MLGVSAPRFRKTENSTYRSSFGASAEPAKTHGSEARAYAHRAWRNGQNPSTNSQFDSEYQTSYRDEVEEDPRLPPVLATCRDFDASIKARCKAHQDLSDF